MKTVAALTLLMAAMAAGQAATGTAATATQAAGAAQPNAAAGAAAPRQVLGRDFFGRGVDNPQALPVLPRLLARVNEVLSVLNAPAAPGAAPQSRTLARVDEFGNVEFTDMFGQEREIVDAFGRNPLDIPGIEEEQELRFQHHRRQQKLQRELAELTRQQQLASAAVAGFAAGGAGAARGGVAAAPVAPAFHVVV